MKYKNIILVLSIIMLIDGCAVVTNRKPYAVIDTYGIYQRQGEWHYIPFDESPVGYERVAGSSNDFKYVKKTIQIPAIKCIAFGYRYTIYNLKDIPEDKIRQIYKHPLMQDYYGTKTSITTTEWPIHLRNGKYTGNIGYSFDSPFEEVPGEWDLIVEYHGKKLLQKKFNITLSNLKDISYKKTDCK